MAVYVKAIPTLKGEDAVRFILKSEENLQKRAAFSMANTTLRTDTLSNSKKNKFNLAIPSANIIPVILLFLFVKPGLCGLT